MLLKGYFRVFILIALALVFPGITAKRKAELIPIAKIGDTELSTGVFYFIDSLAHYRAHVTPAEGWVFARQKSDPKGVGFYEIGTPGYLQAQFMIVPAKKDGFYYLVHHDDPLALIYNEYTDYCNGFANSDSLKLGFHAYGNSIAIERVGAAAHFQFIKKNESQDVTYYNIMNFGCAEKIPGFVTAGWNTNGYVKVVGANVPGSPYPFPYDVLSSDPTAQFSFTPALTLSAEVISIKTKEKAADLVQKHSTRVDLVTKTRYNNKSNITLHEKFSYARNVTDTLSYGFTQSLDIMTKVSGSATIPFIGKLSYEVAVSVGQERNKQWSNTTTKTYSYDRMVEVPPHTCVQIDAWYSRFKDKAVKFNATVSVTGTADKMQINRKVIRGKFLSGSEIAANIENTDFDGVFEKADDDAAYYTLYGSLSAEEGLDDHREQKNTNCTTGEVIDSKPLT